MAVRAGESVNYLAARGIFRALASWFCHFWHKPLPFMAVGTARNGGGV
jgi:hypothetical protein